MVISLIYLHEDDMQHIVGKLLMRDTILFWTSSQLEVCIKHYGPPKSQESLFREFWDSQLGSLRTKWHLCASPLARHREYHKGGRWWLPPSPGRGGSYESMYVRGLSVHQKCSNYTLINLLFGLCRFMWIIGSLVIHPSPHPEASKHRSTLEVLRGREHALTPYRSIIFTFGLAVKSIKEFEVRQMTLLGFLIFSFFPIL